MIVYRIDSLAGFQRHWQQTQAAKADQRAYTKTLCAPHLPGREPFTVRAFSYSAGQVVELNVTWPPGGSDEPNWRETLICPITGLITRARACVQLIDSHLNLHPDSPIYLTEQISTLYRHLRRRFPHLVGSEYLGSGSLRGQSNQDGIRHEDLTNLSFPNDSFEAVLSFECLEHIPDFKAAIAEAHRVLRPGGALLISAPFAAGQQDHIIRAQLRPDRSTVHLLPPEYHGDPMQSAGCLCYTQFGWRLLDDLRDAGFQEPTVLALSSLEFGYLGEELLFFFAKKQP